MGKKSQSQLRRLRQRAEARGEPYVEPSPSRPADGPTTSGARCSADPLSSSSPPPPPPPPESDAAESLQKRRVAAAERLQKSLEDIASNSDLKAKDRRSAKRRAEAVAAEESGLPAAELLDWHHHHHQEQQEHQSRDDDGGGALEKRNKKRTKRNPYVAFVGQLSYETTSDGLLAHFRNHLGGDAVTPETLKIRLLTRERRQGGEADDGGGNGKASSRGMAFAEASTPELLYSLLSLHHTVLDGRRINVERTAGGGRSSDRRRDRITALRQDQQSHQRDLIRTILRERGLLRKGDENGGGDGDPLAAAGAAPPLDDGVIQLCERHAAAAVTAALDRFDETNGPDKDNPSAYLTFLLTHPNQSQEGPKDSRKLDSQQPRRRAPRPPDRSGEERHEKKRRATNAPRRG